MTISKVARIQQLLMEQKAALESAIADITNAATPLREERDALTEQIAPAQARIYEINAALKDLEQPELAALKTQLHAVELALGQKAMQLRESAKAEGETVTVTAADVGDLPVDGGAV